MTKSLGNYGNSFTEKLQGFDAQQKSQTQSKSKETQGMIVEHLSVQTLSTAKQSPMESTALVIHQSTVGKESACEGFKSLQASKADLPKVTSCPKVTYTCEQVEGAIKDSIAKLQKEVDYNAFNSVTGFLKFLDEERKVNPTISEYEAFQKFNPDSKEEVSKTRGGICVGHGYAVVQTIAKNIVQGQPVTGYVITESGGGKESPEHAAVVVPCLDGVVLIEFMWDKQIMSIKHETGLIDVTADKKFTETFRIIEIPGGMHVPNKPIIMRVQNSSEGTVHREYLIRSDHNPDLSVTKHWFLDTMFYPTTSPKDSTVKSKSVIKFDLARGAVVFQVGEGKDAIRCNISFTELDIDLHSTPMKIRNPEFQAFIKENPQFFSHYKTKANIIINQVSLMSKNFNSMISLHIENKLTKLKDECGQKDTKAFSELVSSLGQLLRHSEPNEILKKFARSLKFTPQQVDLIAKAGIQMRSDVLKKLDESKKFTPPQIDLIAKTADIESLKKLGASQEFNDAQKESISKVLWDTATVDKWNALFK